TDQMGVAYYGNYLRWFEIGRTELLRQANFPYKSIEAQGLHFPVTEVSCRYFKPARYDDAIVIETKLSDLGRASLTFHYRLYRQDGDELIAEGSTKHACVDEKGEVTRIPPDLQAVLKPAVSGKE
ncbi:MAG: acyl-CoA thioesterase, partial [Deltaproteobacteria bacterium]|nr:acyl-CoA thioesterase [Deltaproteobacteria bacterium]